jgi:hypothetical protein
MITIDELLEAPEKRRLSNGWVVFWTGWKHTPDPKQDGLTADAYLVGQWCIGTKGSAFISSIPGYVGPYEIGDAVCITPKIGDPILTTDSPAELVEAARVHALVLLARIPEVADAMRTESLMPVETFDEAWKRAKPEALSV